MKFNLKSLSSPWFLFGLAVLLLNDFYLKSAFPGGLTGKLSDFAGLFVFAWFWLAIVPRHKILTLFTIAISFVWWKSPLSSGFIQFWNDLPLWNIQRVVDFSDLMALIMLPIAYFIRSDQQKTGFKISPVIPVLIFVFAVSATSSPDHDPNSIPEFNAETMPNRLVKQVKYPLDLMWEEVFELLPYSELWQGSGVGHVEKGARLEIQRFHSVSGELIWVFEGELRPVGEGSELILNSLKAASMYSSEEMLTVFDREFVNRIRLCEDELEKTYTFSESCWEIKDSPEEDFTTFFPSLITSLELTEFEKGNSSHFKVGLMRKAIAFGRIWQTPDHIQMCLDSARNLCGEYVFPDEISSWFDRIVIEPMETIGYGVERISVN